MDKKKPKSQWKGLVIAFMIIIAVFGGAGYYMYMQVDRPETNDGLIEIPTIISSIYGQNGESAIISLGIDVGVENSNLTSEDLIPIIDMTVSNFDLNQVSGSGSMEYIQNSISHALIQQGGFEISGVFISDVITSSTANTQDE